ncbi:MAG: signal peptidase I [Clostridia bacterium]|nr:signal peptidase I [Clostridia bacterium]MBP3597810.1 signal peptidase I [Clostridia bacterium]
MNEKLKNVLEWIYCIVIAFVLALVFRYFIATPTIVKQRSMFPTLKADQRLVLNRTYRITGKEPEVGDIVTFEAPSKTYTPETVNQNNPVAIYDRKHNGLFSKFLYYTLEITKTSYIKRVIASEGQHVVIRDNIVYIDGKKFDESDYLSKDVVTISNNFNDFIVPEGYVFCMGDNRSQSTDCRDFGCVPIEKIEGIVVFRFWPFNSWGKIE